MNIYQKLLFYYFDSDEFSNNLDLFFRSFSHYGSCVVDDQPCADVNTHYPYYSLLWKQYHERAVASGWPFSPELSDNQIMYYFTKDIKQSQLFATMFALWYGLSNDQVRQISNPRRSGASWQLLHYFLCNPTAESGYLHDGCPCPVHYSGTYFIEIDGKAASAEKEDDVFVLTGGGARYRQLPPY